MRDESQSGGRVRRSEAEMAQQCPEPVEGLAWIYILLMRNDMLYVGQSKNVSNRIRRHSEGSGSRQAKQLKNFTLVYTEGPMEATVTW